MRSRTYFIALLLIGITFFLSAIATAQESEGIETVRFHNGKLFEFTPIDLSENGTTIYHVARDNTLVPVEFFNGEALEPGIFGEIGCFEISYNRKTDLMRCTALNGDGSWFTNYYRGTDQGLQLRKVEHQLEDDPTTRKNESKTITVYSRKK